MGVLSGYKYVSLDADKDTSHINSDSNTLRKIDEIASKFYCLEQENKKLKQQNEELKRLIKCKEEGYDPEVFTCYTKTISCKTIKMTLKKAKEDFKDFQIPYATYPNDEGYYVEIFTGASYLPTPLKIWLTKEDFKKYFNISPTIL